MMIRRRPTDEILTEVGDDVVIAGQFFDDAGNLIDPTSVFVRLRTADDAVVVLQFGVDEDIEWLGVGSYQIVWKVPSAGRHYWRLWGEGNVERAHVGTIVALGDPTAPKLFGTGSMLAGTAVRLSGTGNVT